MQKCWFQIGRKFLAFRIWDKITVVSTVTAYGLQTAPDTPQTGILQGSASQHGRFLVPIMFKSS